MNNTTLMTINYEYLPSTLLPSSFLEASPSSSSSPGSPSSQFIETEYLYPVRDPLYIVIPLTLIYSIIFLTGVLGNIITCIVISRNKSMHTATNYYLFSLAVSDLLLLFSGLPQEMYNMWYNYPYPFNEVVCVCQGFAAETSANATVLTITAFTIERYVAICHPFLSHTMSKLSRAVKFVLGIWVIAMCLAIPQTLDLGITHHKTCTIKDPDLNNNHIFAVSTIIVFVFPMAVITILYILIGLQLRKSKVVNRGTISGSSVRLKHNMFKRPSNRTVVTTVNDGPAPVQKQLTQQNLVNGKNHNNSSSFLQPNNIGGGGIHNLSGQQQHHQLQLPPSMPQQQQQKPLESPEDGRINYSKRAQSHGTRHVVNMLVAVVVAFFICWAPFHAQRLYATYLGQASDNEHVAAVYTVLTHISGVLYFVSTCINPFLYNIMSYKFREAFKDTLARYLYRRTGRPSPHQASSLHSLQRPLVVSFRKIPKETGSSSFTSESSSNFNHDYSDLAGCSSSGGGGGGSCSGGGGGQLRKFNEIPFKKLPRSICIQSYSKSCFDYSNSEAQLKDSSSSTSYNDDKNFENFYNINKVTSYHSDERDECMILESRKRIQRLDEKILKSRSKRKIETFKEIKLTAVSKSRGGGIGKCLSEENFNHNTSETRTTTASSNLTVCPRTADKKASWNKTYKSPYESPELSTNYKKLEDNLRLILEDLVLYSNHPPSDGNYNHHHHRQEQNTHHQATSIDLKNMKRCSSLPLLGGLNAAGVKTKSTIYSRHQPTSKETPKKELSWYATTQNVYAIDDNSIFSTDSGDSGVANTIHEEQNHSTVIDMDAMHPLNILIKESEKTFG